MKHRLLITAAYITVILALSLSLLASYWLLRPYDILTTGPNHLKPLGVAQPGKEMVFSIDMCKTLPYVAVVDTFIEDGLVFPFQQYQTNRPIGCYDSQIAYMIPEYFPDGVYRIRMIHTYKPNPLRTVQYTYVSEDFIVLR